MQKGFSTLLIVIATLIIALAAGGYYYAQKPSSVAISQPSSQQVSIAPAVQSTPVPTTDQMADWKFYSDEQHSYSIKYPSDKFVNCADVALYYQNQCEEGGGQSYPSFVVIVSKINSAKKDSDYSKLLASEIIKSEQVSIDNVTGIKYTGDNPQIGINETNMVLKKNNFVYVITMHYNRSGDPQGYKKLLDQILSTFKFNDQTISPTPTCIPRPKCLDSTPRCLIPEPISGWCK